MLKFGNTYLNYNGTYFTDVYNTANNYEPQFVLHHKRTSAHDLLVHYYDNSESAYNDFTANNIAYFSKTNLFKNGSVNVNDIRMIKLEPQPCWPPLSSKNSPYSACLYHNPTNEKEGYFYFLSKDLDNNYLADLTNNTESNPGSGEILLYKTPERAIEYPDNASIYAFENERYSAFRNIYNTSNKMTVNLRKMFYGWTFYFEQYLSANTPKVVENLSNVNIKKAYSAVNDGWYGGWLLTASMNNCSSTTAWVVYPFNKVENCLNCTVVGNRNIPTTDPSHPPLTEVSASIKNCTGGKYELAYVTANNCYDLTLAVDLARPQFTIYDCDNITLSTAPNRSYSATAHNVNYINASNNNPWSPSSRLVLYNCKISGNNNYVRLFRYSTSAGFKILKDCVLEDITGTSGRYHVSMPVITWTTAERNWLYSNGNSNITLSPSVNHVSAGYWYKTSTRTRYPNYIDNGSDNVFYQIGTF